MPTLTAEQVEFLARHNVPLAKTFDASGLSKSEYRAEMRERSLWVAYGVTQCRRLGHTMRTRTGDCVQCRPAGLSYLRRHDETMEVYVAYSRKRRLVKIGVGESAAYRVRLLNSEMYALATDWQLKHAQMEPRAGAIESAVHSTLAHWAVRLKYVKDGKVVEAKEVFRVPLKMAIGFVKHYASNIDA